MCEDRESTGDSDLPKEGPAKNVKHENAQDQDIDISKIRILVIDDQPTIRDLFHEILSRDGYPFRLAISSDEGLEYFNEGLYDIVYVDLAMPGKSGLEIALEIKGKSPETVVILITGWALEQEMDSKQLKENGIDLIVTKPFRVHHIRDSIEQAMKIKRETSRNIDR